MNNSHVTKTLGTWIDFDPETLVDGDLMLIHDKSRIRLAVFNRDCECFDDEDGDDILTSWENVDKVLLIPNVYD